MQQQGIVARRTGRYPQARQHLGRALQLADQTGDRRTRGSTLYNLGIVHRRLGECRRASPPRVRRNARKRSACSPGRASR
ncbi:tetratricopeptide repeat protein [Micromonospora chersina]|uniref:tetratricopeptide repeat protein n=1 Tax=Micromonospora chersina TaxID=47854 RepID=UPI000B8205BE